MKFLAGVGVKVALGVALLGNVITIQAQWSAVRLHSFGQTNLLGEYPGAGLLLASDGWLYGTAAQGGMARQGVLYKIQPDGSGYAVLWHFGAAAGDGANPGSELMESSDGRLYGTTRLGGLENSGTIFRINKDGTDYTILRHLSQTDDGRYPVGRLVVATNGYIYGTVSSGKQWPSYEGGIFRMNQVGSEFTPLHFFAGGTNDGAVVYSSLLAIGNALFGTTYSGGSFSQGTVFRLNLDGSDYRILWQFGPSADGTSPQAQLIEDGDGRLYGVAIYGGNSSKGVVFRLDQAGANYEVLHRFGSSGADGANPVYGLNWGPDGCLYGVTQAGGVNNAGVLFKLDRNGGNFSVVRHFEMGTQAGWKPGGGLAFGSSNAVFGVTQKGGLAAGGTLYKISLDTTNHTVLQHFPKASVAGETPAAALVEGPDGALYGSASGGFWDQGLVFRINRGGDGFTVLRQFGVATNDGSSLRSGVVIASDAAIYGVTERGGQDGEGTLFRMNLDGSGFTNLHHFGVNFTDGFFPVAGLVEDRDGWLYGSCTWGGTNGNGTLFRIQKDGNGYAVIRHFSSLDNVGGAPRQALLEGLDGVLYGITDFPLTSLFKVNKDGSGFAVLRKFDFTLGTQIGRLKGPLVQGTNGILYGTTMFLDDPRGTVGATIFKISTNGADFAVVRRLQYASTNQANCKIYLTAGDANWLFGAVANNGDGGGGLVFRFNPMGMNYEELWTLPASGASARNPSAALLRASDGNFYGVTVRGGDLDAGAMFRLGDNLLNPVQIGSFSLADRSFRFKFQAESNLLYQVEYRPGGANDWLPLCRHQGSSGPVTITDTNQLETMRWYRIRMP